jgi:hypothetical protein
MTDNPDQLVALTSTPDEPRAALVIAALADRGVEAVPEGGLACQFRTENFGEVKVMVRHEDLDRARESLAEYKAAMSDIDWDEVDVGEME